MTYRHRDIIPAADRVNTHTRKHHLYKYDDQGVLFPMCQYGWNRSNGEAYSILRNNISRRGCCKICLKNVEDGMPPVKDGWPHKTMLI